MREYQRLSICYLRLTTALQVDEQSDTHALYNWYNRFVCEEGIISLNAHNGKHIQHTRDINSALSLTCNWVWLFQIANRQSIVWRFSIIHCSADIVYAHARAINRLLHYKNTERNWNSKINHLLLWLISIWNWLLKLTVSLSSLTNIHCLNLAEKTYDGTWLFFL